MVFGISMPTLCAVYPGLVCPRHFAQTRAVDGCSRKHEIQFNWVIYMPELLATGVTRATDCGIITVDREAITLMAQIGRMTASANTLAYEFWCCPSIKPDFVNLNCCTRSTAWVQTEAVCAALPERVFAQI